MLSRLKKFMNLYHDTRSCTLLRGLFMIISMRSYWPIHWWQGHLNILSKVLPKMFMYEIILLPLNFLFRHIASQLQSRQYIQTSHVRRIPAYTSFPGSDPQRSPFKNWVSTPVKTFRQTSPASCFYYCAGVHTGPTPTLPLNLWRDPQHPVFSKLFPSN